MLALESWCLIFMLGGVPIFGTIVVHTHPLMLWGALFQICVPSLMNVLELNSVMPDSPSLSDPALVA